MSGLEKRVERLESDHAAKFEAAAGPLLALLTDAELQLLADYGEHDARARPALARLAELATPEERVVLGFEVATNGE